MMPTVDVDAAKWLQAKAPLWFPGSRSVILVLRMVSIVNYFLSGVPVPSFTSFHLLVFIKYVFRLEFSTFIRLMYYQP